MRSRQLFLALAVACCATTVVAPAAAQRGGRGLGNAAQNQFPVKSLPFEPGFRAYIVSNMAGMGAAVDPKEVMTGTENGAPVQSNTAAFGEYDTRYRSLATQEANAAVRGARLGGARSFVVSDAHPTNAFGNLLPWELDSGAVLVRGWPRPLFMISGIDSTFGTLMFDGAVAGAGSNGIMTHTFGFESFTVNGKKLNEVGIMALIAGEMGVSVSMVAGDDAAVDETRGILGNGFVGVITKYAVGRQAGITYSPTRVRQMVSAGAAEAVRREKSGAIPPFTMSKPYRVEFTVQNAMTDDVIAQVAALPGYNLEKIGPRAFRFTTESARQIGLLIDAMQPAVIR